MYEPRRQVLTSKGQRSRTQDRTCADTTSEWKDKRNLTR